MANQPPSPEIAGLIKHILTKWWQLKDLLIFIPKNGEDEPNLTHIFSDGLETANQLTIGFP